MGPIRVWLEKLKAIQRIVDARSLEETADLMDRFTHVKAALEAIDGHAAAPAPPEIHVPPGTKVQ
ncbi:MAG: hypothetical protein NUW22_12680 [Acidobacteria bacterium]|nr:hypothetical protein [Acidobacteriota bacterium]